MVERAEDHEPGAPAGGLPEPEALGKGNGVPCRPVRDQHTPANPRDDRQRGQERQCPANLGATEVQALELPSAAPGIPGTLRGGPLVEPSLSAGAELSRAFLGEVRHAPGDFEKGPDQEIRRVMVEPGHSHEPAEIGEVVESNALL